LSALATQATTLTLRKTAPDTELLAIVERVFETIIAHYTTATYLFGFASRCTTFWEEQVWVDTETVGLILPGSVCAQRYLFVFHVNCLR
jgi:hypothetical protein